MATADTSRPVPCLPSGSVLPYSEIYSLNLLLESQGEKQKTGDRAGHDERACLGMMRGPAPPTGRLSRNEGFEGGTNTCGFCRLVLRVPAQSLHERVIMDGAREIDRDDPAEHVSAIRGKKSHFAASKHVLLANEDFSDDDDVGTANGGMPLTRLTYREKMARARATFTSKSIGVCADSSSAELDQRQHESVGCAPSIEHIANDDVGPLRRCVRSLARALALARSCGSPAVIRLVALLLVSNFALAVLLSRSSQPPASAPPAAFVIRPRPPSPPHTSLAVSHRSGSSSEVGPPSSSSEVASPSQSLLEYSLPPRPRPRPPAPPPPAPQKSPPPLSPTALLNARYLYGQSSNDVAAAGILIHQLDGIDLGDLRDDFGRPKKPWMPCPATGMTWCSDIGDRMSASIINAQLPHLFSDVAAGFIINPQAKMLCSFPKDGGTMSYTCTADEPGCVPGCYGAGHLRKGCENLVKGCYDPDCVQNMLGPCPCAARQVRPLLPGQCVPLQ